MKKLLLALSAILVIAVTAVLADTILRPPTIQWAQVTTYSDGRDIEPGLVVKYNVYRSTLVDTNWVKVTTTTNLTYTDASIVLGSTYRYQVAAELYGLEATPSPATTFRVFAPAATAAPVLQQ